MAPRPRCLCGHAASTHVKGEGLCLAKACFCLIVKSVTHFVESPIGYYVSEEDGEKFDRLLTDPFGRDGRS